MSDKTASPELPVSATARTAANPVLATPPKPAAMPKKNAWRYVWHVYAEAATLRMLLLGFSAGLPLLLVFGVPASPMAQPWPVVGGNTLSALVGMAGMALSDPKLSLETIVWFALLTAFGSVTQDIALDAFRIEVFGRGADAAGRSNRRGNR